MALINWATHVLQGYNNWKQKCKLEQIHKQYHSSDCRLQLACMKEESLVIVNQHVTVNVIFELCTHRPSRYGSKVGWKILSCFLINIYKFKKYLNIYIIKKRVYFESRFCNRNEVVTR